LWNVSCASRPFYNGRGLLFIHSSGMVADGGAETGWAMYLRFVVADLDEDSGRELGVFHAARHLRDDEKLHPDEEEQLDVIFHWVSVHLEKPTRFTASKPPFYRKKNKAISWFEDSAHEHLAHVREMVVILESITAFQFGC